MSPFYVPACTNVDCGDTYNLGLPSSKKQEGNASAAQMLEYNNHSNANKAASKIASLLNDAPYEDPINALRYCQHKLNELQTDEDFIRLLNPRIPKLLDRMIIPSLLACLQVETFTASTNSKMSKAMMTTYSIINKIAEMKQWGLLISDDQLYILLDNLILSYRHIPISENNSDLIFEIEAACVNIVSCLEINTTSLSWLTYQFHFSKDGSHLQSLCTKLFDRLLDTTAEKGHILPDPRLYEMAVEIIPNISSTDDGMRVLLAKLGNLHPLKTLEALPAKSSILSEEKKTVVVYDSFALHQQKLNQSELHCLTLERYEAVALPSWMEIFDNLTIKSTEPGTTKSIQQVTPFSHPKRAHLERFFEACSKLYQNIFKFNRVSQQRGKQNKWSWLSTRWYLVPEKQKQQKQKHLTVPRNKKRKKGKKNWGKAAQRKRRQIYLQSRHKRNRLGAIQRNRNQCGPRRRSQLERVSAQQRRLHYYYKLQTRTAEARQFKDMTLEKTHLGEIRGNLHKFQLKWQSKADRFKYYIHGIEHSD